MSEEQEMIETDETGVYQYLINRMGWDDFVEMCKQFGGQKIYLPRRPYTEDRNREIRDEFQNIVEGTFNGKMAIVYRRLSERVGRAGRGIEDSLDD